MPNPHLHRIRVRYAESDQMGLAHHGAYVGWLEEARIEWLRANGLSYRELEVQGVLMPVTELALDYRRPLRFDDQVELTTSAVLVGPTRVAFTTVLRVAGAGEVTAEGRVTIACVGRDGRPKRLPAEVAATVGTGPEVR
ncbi:MAG: acyl-CoA thioesterase [Planctomycetes bacterium]|nr:acyl-CoA thioesterase [Planctomycetota bacterium]